MFEFFLTRGVTAVAWIGGAIGAGIVIYALLDTALDTGLDSALETGQDPAPQVTLPEPLARPEIASVTPGETAPKGENSAAPTTRDDLEQPLVNSVEAEPSEQEAAPIGVRAAKVPVETEKPASKATVEDVAKDGDPVATETTAVAAPVAQENSAAETSVQETVAAETTSEETAPQETTAAQETASQEKIDAQETVAAQDAARPASDQTDQDLSQDALQVARPSSGNETEPAAQAVATEPESPSAPLDAEVASDVVQPEQEIEPTPEAAVTQTGSAALATAQETETPSAASEVSNETTVVASAQADSAVEPKAAPEPVTQEETAKDETAKEETGQEEPIQDALAATNVPPNPEATNQEPEQTTAAILSPNVPEAGKISGNAPTFDLIRIDSKGSAVFAGRAEPNANVDILANGALLGTATASPNGEFVALLETPETASPQTIELVARALDGGVARSAEPVIVLGRLSEPERPQVADVEAAADVAMPAVVRTDGDDIELVQAPRSLATDQVVLDTITYDAQSTVVLVGRGQAGREVRVYANGDLQGSTTISGDGRWRLLISKLSAGNYTLRADQIGGDGAVASRFETPFQRQFPTAETLARLQDDENEIVVQPGFNLWTIARNRYGEGVKYTVIFDANKDQIRDPDLIYPGQVFALPEAQ